MVYLKQFNKLEEVEMVSQLAVLFLLILFSVQQ